MIYLYTILILLAIMGFLILLGKFQISRFGYWLLGGYLILLIASVIAYTFIPIDEFADDNEIEEMTNRTYFVHEILDQGVPIEEFKEYKKEEWEFSTATGEGVSLYDNTGDDYHFPIIIKRVENQEAIHINLYEIEPEIEVEPVYDDASEFKVNNQGGALTIQPPGQKLYRFTGVEKGFPFNQFEEDEDYHWRYYDIFNHARMFYITIPADIELNTSPETDVYWLN